MLEADTAMEISRPRERLVDQDWEGGRGLGEVGPPLESLGGQFLKPGFSLPTGAGRGPSCRLDHLLPRSPSQGGLHRSPTSSWQCSTVCLQGRKVLHWSYLQGRQLHPQHWGTPCSLRPSLPQAL